MFFYGKKFQKRMKRVICFLLILISVFILFPAPIEAEELKLYSTGAVLMDADTGRILYGKNEDTFLANASTTKILTCIVALENASLDEIVEVSAYAASMPKVKLYMKQGEHYKLKDLLYSLMLESHNDTAMAIAEHVGGSLEGFTEMMNNKASDIGCCNSLFLTPNGLDAEKKVNNEKGEEITLTHGTTATDLAKIMSYCSFQSEKAEEFLKITTTANYQFQNEEGRSFNCTNHNAFLQMMEGALTGKTGFTGKAGYCYVAALQRDGKRFVIALLGCGWPNNKTYKWKDAKNLFSYGLQNYEYFSFDRLSYKKELPEKIVVHNGQTEKINQVSYTRIVVNPGKMQGLLLAKDENIELVTNCKDTMEAPVKQGESVGKVFYILQGEIVRSDDILTCADIKRIDYFWCFDKVLKLFLLR